MKEGEEMEGDGGRWREMERGREKGKKKRKRTGEDTSS
jgi:hypothetical protein